MTTAFTATCLLALVAADLAGACSCAFSPWTTTRDRLQDADAAFVGTIVQRTQGDAQPGEPFPLDVPVQLRFRVERSFKGDLGSEVVVHTSSNDGLCGISAGVGRRLALLLGREGDHYTAGSCSVTSAEALADAVKKLPQARARGPVRYLVAGSFGKTGVIALDRRGRPLGYGKEVGATAEVSVCRGGRRTLEIAYVGEQPRLHVRDLRSMRLLRREKLPGQVVAVSCRSRDAGDYVALLTGKPRLVSGEDQQNAKSRLISVGPKGFRVLLRGRGRSAAIGTRFVWMATTATQLTRIDLLTGAQRRVTVGSAAIRLMAPSPDGRRVAVESMDGLLRMLDGAGLSASRRGASSPLWTDDDTLVVQAGSFRSPLLRAVNDRLFTIRTLRASWRSVLTGHRGRLLAIDDARRLSSIDARSGRVRRLARIPVQGSRLLVTVGGETRLRRSARKPCSNRS